MFTTILVPLFFALPPIVSISSAVTQFGLMGLEMEMQLGGYHRYWGCSITIVNCAKDFHYSGFLCTVREEIRNRGDEFRASLVYHISYVFSTCDNHAMLGHCRYKSPLPLVARIE